MKSIDGDILHEPKEWEERFRDHKDHSESLPISKPVKGEPCHLKRAWKIVESHPKHQIIGDMSQRITRTSLRNLCDHSSFLSYIKPKNVNEALNDKSWFLAMQDKLH